MVLRKTGEAHKEWNWFPILHHSQRSAQNRLKTLNIRIQTLKLLGENTGSKLIDIGLSNICFLNVTTQTKATKAKVTKWNYIKLKSVTKYQGNANQSHLTPCKMTIANSVSRDVQKGNSCALSVGVRLVQQL